MYFIFFIFSHLSTGLWPGDMTELMILTLSELKSDWLSQPKVSRPAVVITRQLAESLTDQHHVKPDTAD